MEAKGKTGLIIAAILSLAAIFAPLQYSPVAFIILIGWAILNKANPKTIVGGMLLFALSMGIAGFLMGMSLENSAFSAIRAFTIVMPVFIFFSTSSMHETMETLSSVGVPKDISFMFSISIPYSKVLARKANSIRIAQASRNSRSPWAFFIPLLNFVFERAKVLAVSMESRGFESESSS
jgi:energy-coupling factor transporter transmembrane protein EcfT